MTNLDWDAPAELFRLEEPLERGSARTQISLGTLRECIGQAMAFAPAERPQLAVFTADHPPFRSVDIEMLARRADLGGWLKVD